MKEEMIKEVLIVLAMVIGTQITRFLPFLLFPEGKKTPEFVTYLSRTLPYAMMGLLVVYCLRNIHISAAPYGVPELLATVWIIILHRWKHNTLFSIGTGTVFYMFLVQRLF